MNPIWHSSLRNIERIFIENLRNRAAPALQQGVLTTVQLEHIAFALIEKNTDQLENANEMISGFDEKKPPKRPEITLNYLIRSKPGKFGLSVFFGFFLIFSLLWIQAFFTPNNIWTSIEKPGTITGGITCSSFIYLVFFRES